MGKKISKREAISLFAASGRARSHVNSVQFERELKWWLDEQGLSVRSWGKNYQDNSDESGAQYTMKLLKTDAELRRTYPVLQELCNYNAAGSQARRVGYSSAAEAGEEASAGGYWSGMVRHYTQRAGRAARGGSGGGNLLSSPFGILLVVAIAAVLFYKLLGPTVYALITSGPLFYLFCLVVGVLVIRALVRSGSINWGFAALVIGILALVALYKSVGPGLYAALMSGALFQLLLYPIALAVSVGILRAKNMGWPLPVKLVVIGVIWLVITNY